MSQTQSPLDKQPNRMQIFEMIDKGMSNREIASTLFVTEATVKTHVNNVFSKLDVSDRAAAVAWAFRTGLAT